ncbi:MAG TPA: ABC-type transport auxiliary lipoprotein family protein [Gammaproteobacteria bacterium]|nr:ABC-type transport auxiliary lipoprotein family protein [Gammaproteobacteria bacterium]
MKIEIKKLMLSAAIIGLSGCSFMSPVKNIPDCGYMINAVPNHVKTSRRHSGVMMVMVPDINSAYNTSKIAFTTRPYQLSYYNNSHWIQSPQEMLSPLLVATLQKTGRFKTVTMPPLAGQYNYALRTQIKALYVDYTERTPVLRLKLQEDLVAANSGRVIASRNFSAAEPLPAKTPYAAVYAANQATEKLLAEIAAWCVSRIYEP